MRSRFGHDLNVGRGRHHTGAAHSPRFTGMKPPVSRLLSALGIAALLALGLLGCGGGTATVTKTVTISEEGGGGAFESSEESEPSEAVPPLEGGIGDTLTLPDEYETNGNVKDDELAWTLVAFDEDVTPDGDPYSIKEAEKGGNKLVRAQFTVKQEAPTESGSFDPNVLTAIDTEGQAYLAEEGKLFAPELFPAYNSSIALAPGEERKGYVAFAVPEGSTIAKLEVKDSGYTAPDLAIWTLH